MAQNSPQDFVNRSDVRIIETGGAPLLAGFEKRASPEFAPHDLKVLQAPRGVPVSHGVQRLGRFLPVPFPSLAHNRD